MSECNTILIPAGISVKSLPSSRAQACGGGISIVRGEYSGKLTYRLLALLGVISASDRLDYTTYYSALIEVELNLRCIL